MNKTKKGVILGIGLISIILTGLVLPKPYKETKNASDSEILAVLKKNAKEKNLSGNESEKNTNEEAKEETAIEAEESVKDIAEETYGGKEESYVDINKVEGRNKKEGTVVENKTASKVNIKEEVIVKNEIIEEPEVKEYKPVGTVNTAGKIIFIYDNINIVYVRDDVGNEDKYKVFVWHKDFGWFNYSNYTVMRSDKAPLSMEHKFYAYISNIEFEGSSNYKVELVVYPHPNRQKEGKCNIYKEGTEELVKSLPLSY